MTGRKMRQVERLHPTMGEAKMCLEKRTMEGVSLDKMNLTEKGLFQSGEKLIAISKFVQTVGNTENFHGSKHIKQSVLGEF